MGRQEEALRVAEELLTDIELQRLKATEVALKASRLARLVGHTDLSEFLELERNGYQGANSSKWIDRAGRSMEENKFRPTPLAQIEASVRATEQALDALRGGGNYSGDYIITAGRNHDDKIVVNSRNLAQLAGITGQVVSTIYEMVVEIYHELLFSELQATLFEDAQGSVDGALASASGSALEKN
jgi:hypothetical protein